MSVILERHTFGLFCTLGDGTLTAPLYYPGLFERPDGVAANTGNVVGYENYPATTPDNIVKLIRAAYNDLPGSYSRLLTGPCGYTANATVTAGFPPSPIAGSPFSADERTSTPYSNIFPRWSTETVWDLNAFPATANFTPQGLTSSGINCTVPIVSAVARYGVSVDSGTMANDPSDGGDSTYDQEAEFKVFVQANSVCCWNDGAQIELNLEVWQIDFTPTPVAGSPGVFTFTLGTPSYYSTLTQTVTIDPSWESGSFIPIHTFTIPKVTGHFTFVNDFYVSSVTAP